MKFKQFLRENNNNLDSIIKQIIDKTPANYIDNFINENIQDLNKSFQKIFIFRGTSSNKNRLPIEIRNNPIDRISANTSNEFTLIVDNVISSWKNFPKRSESFICSTSKSTAESYGHAHLVFPLKNTKIGICSNSDMWNSLNRISDLSDGGSVVEFNEVFNSININSSKILSKPVNNMVTASDINDVIMSVQSIIDNGKIHDLASLVNKDVIDIYYDLINKFLFHSNNFKKNLEWILDSKANDLELKRISDISDFSKDYSSREVWFSAPAAFLNMNNILDVIDIQTEMRRLKEAK